MSQPSRIYFDETLQRYADSHIETPYYQIFTRTLSAADREALPFLIDPYGAAYLRERYTLSIGHALHHRRLAAVSWAQQFGKLHVKRAADKRISAHIEGHALVYAPTLEDACLLAGIQVLREHSVRVLSTKAEGRPN